MSITTKFIDSSTSVNLFNFDENVIVDKLPVCVYTVQLSRQGFYLQKELKEYNVPEHVYGDANIKVETLLKRYNSFPKSLGALLIGKKGTGKTLTVNIILNKFINEFNKPVIIVNKKFEDHISDMIEFLDRFEDCLIIFDEMEKHYDEDEQNLFLNFFDDKKDSHRLCLVIANRFQNISQYYFSRPSRFFYHFKFDNLTDEVVAEIVKQHSLEHLQDKFSFYNNKHSFSFDSLLAVISEIKFTGNENLSDIIQYLNIENATTDYSYGEAHLVRAVDVKTNKDLTDKLNELGFTFAFKNNETDGLYYASSDDWNYIPTRTLIKTEGKVFTYRISVKDDSLGKEAVLMDLSLLITKMSYEYNPYTM